MASTSMMTPEMIPAGARSSGGFASVDSMFQMALPPPAAGMHQNVKNEKTEQCQRPKHGT